MMITRRLALILLIVMAAAPKIVSFAQPTIVDKIPPPLIGGGPPPMTDVVPPPMTNEATPPSTDEAPPPRTDEASPRMTNEDPPRMTNEAPPSITGYDPSRTEFDLSRQEIGSGFSLQRWINGWVNSLEEQLAQVLYSTFSGGIRLPSFFPFNLFREPETPAAGSLPQLQTLSLLSFFFPGLQNLYGREPYRQNHQPPPRTIPLQNGQYPSTAPPLRYNYNSLVNTVGESYPQVHTPIQPPDRQYYLRSGGDYQSLTHDYQPSPTYSEQPGNTGFLASGPSEAFWEAEQPDIYYPDPVEDGYNSLFTAPYLSSSLLLTEENDSSTKNIQSDRDLSFDRNSGVHSAFGGSTESESISTDEDFDVGSAQENDSTAILARHRRYSWENFNFWDLFSEDVPQALYCPSGGIRLIFCAGDQLFDILVKTPFETVKEWLLSLEDAVSN